jgi:short-subunit dehydrogenase
MDLRGAVVVVTGASSGIGRSTALDFARHGATVVASARREDLLQELVAHIERRGGAALAVPCDVSEWSQVDDLRRRVQDAFGRCDVLVNNAGVPGGGPFAELSVQQIETVTGVNLMGVLYGTKAFLPMMLAQGRGHVVNVASVAGKYPIPGASVYSATKHAVVAFSESLDMTTKMDGVRVTVVNPVFADTEGFPAASRPGFLTVTPERVADTIVTIVRKGIAPEYSIPRWVAAFQAFHVLTPPLYRWAVGRATRRYAPTRASSAQRDS